MTSSPVSDRLTSFADVQAAATRLDGHAVATPLLTSSSVDGRLGFRLLIKAEALQRTGSFKFRGAFNRLAQLDADERRRGVIAFSSGNHAQGVAAAARLLGIPATIVMPADAPAIKLANTRADGAAVVLYDRYTQDREAVAAGIAAVSGATLVRPYDDPDIIAGQGTVGLELLTQARQMGIAVDALLAPAGGGGLVAGSALACAALSPTTKIYCVEPTDFDDHARSLRAGVRVANTPGAQSICDGLLAGTPGILTFAINRSRLACGLIVSDDEVRQAMRFAFSEFKLVLEPSGAIALAAALTGRIPDYPKAVAVIASGGNVDPALFAEILSIQTASW